MPSDREYFMVKLKEWLFFAFLLVAGFAIGMGLGALFGWWGMIPGVVVGVFIWAFFTLWKDIRKHPQYYWDKPLGDEDD